LFPYLGHDPFIVVRNPRRSSVPSGVGLMAAWLLLAPACAPTRPDPRSPGAEDAELSEAVERLRLERRLRERKIRDLEHELETRRRFSTSAERGDDAGNSTSVPALPVEVLMPAAERTARRSADPASQISELSSPPGDLTVDGERVVGVADDGTEVVYVDDAATGRMVRPSAEALAEVGRSARPSARSPSAVSSTRPPRLDGPELEEGAARTLLDGSGHDRIPPFPAPLSSIGRRTAHARTAPPRTALPSKPELVRIIAAPSPRPTTALDHDRSLAPSVRGSKNGDAESEYRAAVSLVRSGAYPAAIAAFREFLLRHATHDYADNAQYWLGEAFYAQRQYEQALLELRRVLELYPQGNKVPDALLKVGYCHLAMGDQGKSNAVLHELIRLYPKTEPAALAAKKLEESSK
jgi:tol-pal system protein YbgF